MGVVGGDLLDVPQAARLVGRTPETVRRWIWSGRLQAVKRGKKLMMDRSELRRVAPLGGDPMPSWPEWAAEVDTLTTGRSGSSAADLVLEGRQARSRAVARR